MNLPFISAICCTYGRVMLLEEALQCFLNQKYEGRKQLVIFNTYDAQELVFEHPEVKVINSPIRPRTIGDTRNMAISHADGELLVTYDDDDLFLPNHFFNFTRGFDPSRHGWVRLEKQAYAEGWSIKGTSHGSPNVVAVTRKAWQEVGGYDSINCGEDQSFVKKVSLKFDGVSVPILPHQISYIYHWGQGPVWHLSGNGPDVPGQPTGMEKAEKFVKERAGAMLIPTGRVELKPHLKHDYQKMIQTLAGDVSRYLSEKQGRIGIVLLGRYGDILNILPVAKHFHDQSVKPRFYVSRDFADVLDGVSYVEPRVVDLPYDRVNEAVKIASQECELVLNAQVWGVDFQVPRQCGSYNVESWLRAGFANEFQDGQRFPLVLDRRDDERERQVSKPVTPGTILLNLASGFTAPFKDAAMFTSLIRESWAKDRPILDISHLKAHRIYDLLGLFDAAALLITNDTAALHLAAASNIPVIALRNNVMVDGHHWLASVPRCNCVLMVNYDEAVVRQKEIQRVIEQVKEKDMRDTLPTIQTPPKVHRNIYHVVERHPEANEYRRKQKQRAWDSWAALYNDGVIPLHYNDYKRTSKIVGDNRNLPFLKDVLARASEVAMPDDIILWTNDDNLLHPELPRMLRMFLAIYGACTAMRVEYRQPPNLSLPPETVAREGQPHLGRDLFACTAQWLADAWDELPDFLLGAPEFDLCLAAMVRRKRRFHTTRQNIATIIPCCELPPGYLVHEVHPSQWSQLPESNPAHVWNRRNFETWARHYAPEIKVPL